MQAGRGGQAGHHDAVAGDAARHLQGPGALREAVLVHLPGQVPDRRLGARSTRTATSGSSAAWTTSSRSRATGWARRRSSRRWSATRRSPRRRRSACPTRCKGNGIYAYVILRAGQTASPELAEELVAARGHGRSARSPAREDRVRHRPAQDPLGQDHAPGAQGARAGPARGGRLDAGGVGAAADAGHPPRRRPPVTGV